MQSHPSHHCLDTCQAWLQLPLGAHSAALHSSAWTLCKSAFTKTRKLSHTFHSSEFENQSYTDYSIVHDQWFAKRLAMIAAQPPYTGHFLLANEITTTLRIVPWKPFSWSRAANVRRVVTCCDHLWGTKELLVSPHPERQRSFWSRFVRRTCDALHLDLLNGGVSIDVPHEVKLWMTQRPCLARHLPWLWGSEM